MLPKKNEEEVRTRFPKPKWDIKAKRDYLLISFTQPMKFKDNPIDVKHAPDDKILEIFSFFFHGVK